MPQARKTTKKKKLLLQPVEYRFAIDAFTPDTLPMARLAEYMGEFACLLGQTDHVHFARIEKGSATLVSTVEWEAIPKVRERVRVVKYRDPAAPTEAVRAFDNLDRRLALDNA